jgi:NAD(P)-dependent dehydrogenase (short-subunit alcohol dehydrogenase family)
MLSLENKIAVITGGGSGIGQAIALLFAQQGAAIHILEMSEEAGQNTQDLIQAAQSKGFLVEMTVSKGESGQNRKLPSPCVVHACNVADQAAVMATFEKIGRVDILVNNAGIAHIGTAETTTEADFDRILSVNVKGVYNTLKAAIPLMKTNGGGVILNMASVAGLVGLPDRFAYSMSKGAVLAMTMATAKDYLSHHIRCNSISPARIHTPFVDGFLEKNYPDTKVAMFEKLSKTQPIGRMGKPDEVATLALYLCSDEASFITGCDYPIDGGFVKLNN